MNAGELLYKSVLEIAEKYKEDNFEIKEGIWAARSINNHYYTEAVFKNQAGVIAMTLEGNIPEADWEMVPVEIKKKLGDQEFIEKCRYCLLQYRLDNIIEYLVRGRTGYDWSSDASEFLKLYNKYMKYE